MRASQPPDPPVSHAPSSYQREPRWVDWDLYPRWRVPAAVRDWLWERGSLTRRVIASCNGAFRVRLLRQSPDRPYESERHLLGMRWGEQAVVREVQLLCGGQPWVFARTLLPLGSLGGAMRRLTRLGTRPLGEVLFTASDVERLGVQVAQLRPGLGLFATATAQTGELRPGLGLFATATAQTGELRPGPALFTTATGQTAELDPDYGLFGAATHETSDIPRCLWGRRALYALAGKHLLVNEIFLSPIVGVQAPRFP
jgi:chorismate--pyruvate lyase